MAHKALKGIVAMPGASSNKAPSFSGGKASDLLEFFDYFEELADGFELTDAERCKSLVRYVDKSTKRFWVSLEGYETSSYKEFKETILGHYPGYSIRDLERLTKASRDDEITSESELFQYYCDFRPIAIWLVNKGKINEKERNRFFWFGLHPSTRRQIDHHLQLTNPEYTRSQAADMDKVLAVGRVVFSDEAFDAEFDDSKANRFKERVGERKKKSKRRVKEWDSDDETEEEERPKKKETEEKKVKTRKVELDAGKSMIDEVEDLAKKLHGLQVHDMAYWGYYARLVCLVPVLAQHLPAPRSPQNAPPQVSNPNTLTIQSSTLVPCNNYQPQYNNYRRA